MVTIQNLTSSLSNLAAAVDNYLGVNSSAVAIRREMAREEMEFALMDAKRTLDEYDPRIRKEGGN